MVKKENGRGDDGLSRFLYLIVLPALSVVRYCLGSSSLPRFRVIDTLMTYFINNGYDIHGTPKLPMPDVETYIIYTGRSIPRILSSGRLETDSEGRQILSLNKEFFGGEAGKPELTAKVLYVENSDGIIEEYIRFSQVFDEQRMKFKDEPEKVYPEVFRICEEERILTGYLSKHKSEGARRPVDVGFARTGVKRRRKRS